MPTPPTPSDLQWGSFSDHAPWVLDPDAIGWRLRLDPVRYATAREIPRLTRKRTLPPLSRIAQTGASLGFALATWRLLDRRGEVTPAQSRLALSRRLRRSFEQLGPTYIKLGQVVSSGEGIFPEELVSEFRQLRDRVKPQPFEQVRKTIEQDLGCNLDDVFATFNPTPIAAASIAQVHAATLRSGESVVVKVQRSNVAKRVRADLAAMSWIAPSLIGRIPVSALANPPALIELFAETIVEELDFRLEADNMLDVAQVLASTNQRAIIVPRPHPTLVTRRVLVMERLDGFRFDQVADMKAAGVDTAAVVRACMISFLEGALLHGVFHGDLHGGNLLVQPDGRVALLDFGITGRLSEPKRLAFLRMLLGGTQNDLPTQIRALCELGAFPMDTDVDAVIKDLGLDRPAIDPTTATPDELINELRQLTKNMLAYGASLPKELMLFVKDMLFLDGAIATMAPDIDLFAMISDVGMYFATQHATKLAADVGLDSTSFSVNLDGYRNAIGVDQSVTSLTYSELQERRALIRERLEAHQKSTSPRFTRPARLRSRLRSVSGRLRP
jgi:ubiquinone biosynthesis protein